MTEKREGHLGAPASRRPLLRRQDAGAPISRFIERRTLTNDHPVRRVMSAAATEGAACPQATPLRCRTTQTWWTTPRRCTQSKRGQRWL